MKRNHNVPQPPRAKLDKPFRWRGASLSDFKVFIFGPVFPFETQSLNLNEKSPLHTPLAPTGNVQLPSKACACPMLHS
jgi:hypothetical protein